MNVDNEEIKVTNPKVNDNTDTINATKGNMLRMINININNMEIKIKTLQDCNEAKTVEINYLIQRIDQLEANASYPMYTQQPPPHNFWRTTTSTNKGTQHYTTNPS